jgi:hypothetical protein
MGRYARYRRALDMLNISTNQPLRAKENRGPLLPETLSDDDRKVLKSLAEVLDIFMLERGNIPVYYITILLRIALEEGHSQKFYRDRIGYPSSTMSRSMIALGTRAGDARDSLGLIDERASATSLREYEVFLSQKGKALVKRIAKKLRGEK